MDLTKFVPGLRPKPDADDPMAEIFNELSKLPRKDPRRAWITKGIPVSVLRAGQRRELIQAKTAKRKMNERYRRNLVAQQRQEGLEATKAVRAYEVANNLPTGGLASAYQADVAPGRTAFPLTELADYVRQLEVS